MSDDLIDKNFVLRSDDTFSGMIPLLFRISNREIRELMERHRKLNPEDKTPDEDLRPMAVNTILKHRNERLVS